MDAIVVRRYIGARYSHAVIYDRDGFYCVSL